MRSNHESMLRSSRVGNGPSMFMLMQCFVCKCSVGHLTVISKEGLVRKLEAVQWQGRPELFYLCSGTFLVNSGRASTGRSFTCLPSFATRRHKPFNFLRVFARKGRVHSRCSATDGQERIRTSNTCAAFTHVSLLQEASQSHRIAT